MSNICVKNPVVGEIKAEYFNNIIGKKAKRTILADEHIGWQDIEN